MTPRERLAIRIAAVVFVSSGVESAKREEALIQCLLAIRDVKGPHEVVTELLSAAYDAGAASRVPS